MLNIKHAKGERVVSIEEAVYRTVQNGINVGVIPNIHTTKGNDCSGPFFHRPKRIAPIVSEPLTRTGGISWTGQVHYTREGKDLSKHEAVRNPEGWFVVCVWFQQARMNMKREQGSAP